MSNEPPKVIYLETNYNNKLACDFFIHISVEPKVPITETYMEKTVFEIRTKDNSYPPGHFKLVDLSRVQIVHLGSLFTFQSHGMGFFEFAKWFMVKNEITDHHARVAIYQYQRHVS